jgi:hypothetical protein
VASDVPIAGTDQKSEDSRLKLWKEFIGRDAQPHMAKIYRTRSSTGVYKKSELKSPMKCRAFRRR